MPGPGVLFDHKLAGAGRHHAEPRCVVVLVAVDPAASAAASRLPLPESAYLTSWFIWRSGAARRRSAVRFASGHKGRTLVSCLACHVVIAVLPAISVRSLLQPSRLGSALVMTSSAIISGTFMHVSCNVQDAKA